METEEKDPRWRVIATDLRAAILDGRYPPGGALPSEPELVRKYEVSRPTVRKAIDTLVSEGLAYVMRGRGSFVRPMPERRAIIITDRNRPDLAAPGNHPDVQEFGWDLAMKDFEPEAPLFTDEKISANRDVAILLGVRPGHPVIHRRSMWHRGHTARIHGASARLEINSYTNADMLPEWDDPKRYHQFRKRPGFFYQSLISEHGPVRWMTLTTARIAYEDERALLGLDYAEALLIIRRTMAHANGRPIEVTEVKAPANRYEIGYHTELADDPDADLTPQELSDNGIDLVI
ncbi:GntR family transcriptional regulator [Microbispora cellulosiformans]|uniref:GntR family transcriptional regulator n=1 Tax=Microbispora cellulosiformans TaxID=2614688 RepID=A0A5J5K7V6_9ACTN|nr:GntR family transcriptional regulator [Microbispora cellulosiformans]KAA9380840.1 GntR family transcriptional regulator [Microbispora cellulosiformans]